MIDPIDNIINETFEYNVDIFHNLSLSSNVSMIMYSMYLMCSMSYDEFNQNSSYSGNESDSCYNLTKKIKQK